MSKALGHAQTLLGRHSLAIASITVFGQRHAHLTYRLRRVLGVGPVKVVAATFLVMLAAGCSSDGRELAQPEDWQTTTTRPAPPTSALAEEVSTSGVLLSSPQFQPGADIPIESTCAGANMFPTLEWSTVPAGTAEVALTLSDQTNSEEPVLIWLMAGIDPNRGSVESGVLPNGAVETLNDYGNPGYGTPCLEELAGQRDLQFRLYVLDVPSGIQPGDPGNTSWDTLRSSAAESASLLARITGQG